MNRFVNLNILSHPANWATVFVWMFFFAFTVALLEPKLLSHLNTGTPEGNK